MDSNKKVTHTAESLNAQNLQYYLKKEQASKDELFVVASGFFSSVDSRHRSIRALTETLEHWISTEYRKQVRQLSDDDLGYFDEVIGGTFSVINLLAAMSDKVDDIRVLHNAIDETKEGGVNNG